MTYHRLFLFFVIFAFLGIFACKKEKTGDLSVKVFTSFGQPMAGIQIYTLPATQSKSTDQFGSVLLSDLPTGSYEVFAESGIGSGKAFANIQENELTEVTITIIAGQAGNGPNISLVSPNTNNVFAQGDTVHFEFLISDDKDNASQLSVTIESNFDGLLHTFSGNINNTFKFSTDKLSKRDHLITVKAKDSEQYTTNFPFTVQVTGLSPVIMAPAVKNNGKVELSWSKYVGTDFSKYEVYRSNFCDISSGELLKVVTDQNTTTFVDETPPLAYQVCYFVRVYDQLNRSRESNIVTVPLPAGQVFNFISDDLLKHPTQEIVYLVDKSLSKLIKYDYNSQTILAEKDIPGQVGYSEISDNGFGVEIYVPARDGWVYVYDAESLQQTTAISTGLPNTSVVCNGLGHVIVGLSPNPWWESPVRTYRRSDGFHIDGDGGFDGDRLRMIPGKNQAISISTSVSPTDMEYFLFDNQGAITLHMDDIYHGDHPLDPNIFRISPNGLFVITAAEGAVYTANSNMTYKGRVQSGGLAFSDFAFSDDGNTIYLGTSNRNSIQIATYPSLVRDSEILTRSTPYRIAKHQNKLIVLSINQSTGLSAIEIVPL